MRVDEMLRRVAGEVGHPPKAGHLVITWPRKGQGKMPFRGTLLSEEHDGRNVYMVPVENVLRYIAKGLQELRSTKEVGDE